MNTLEKLPLSSVGHQLDTAEEAFGELRDSSYLAGNGQALNIRMQEDGYLFLRGFFRREDVMAAREVMVNQLGAEGLLQPGTDPMEGILKTERGDKFRPDLIETNQPLNRLLYRGIIMDFYREFFGESVRHYDFTWLRTVGPGKGTNPHCDMVYMGRGTREKLLTAWVPLGDVSLSLGGLMILEGSHRQHDLLRPYLERDVDTYCTNGSHAQEIEAGRKQWEWDGALSKDPVTLREKLGGRWLTSEFAAGDLLTFTMYTVHASLDNHSSNRIRISSDSRYQPASLPADERWIGEKPIGHSLAGKRGRIC
jgi:hypothetical protein